MKNTSLTLPLLLVACGGTHSATHPHHGVPHHGAPADHAGGHHHGFEDPETWSQRWEGPERDAWQKPEVVLAALGLSQETTVADVGAGTGYFSVRFAQAVPQGKVYAVDLEPAMVEWLRARAAREGLGNLHAVQATTVDARLPEPVDLVFLANTYHHIGDREGYFRRLRPHLRPGGRLAVVDYHLVTEGHGPPKHLRLAPDQVVAELEAAGYKLVQRDDQSLPRQYLLVFEPGH